MDLNKYSDEVETMENAEDRMSTIFKAKTPDKKNFRLHDDTLLVMKLYDADGDQIPGKAKVEIAGKKPTQRNPREIDEKPYRPYNQISVDRQYDESNQGELKIEVDPGHIDFIEGHEILIRLKSDKVVDWENEDSIIEFNVEEQPYRDR